jgi:hypothetical protein
VKLFQIEEPDGSPADPDAPGAAIGIDIAGPRAEVAVAVGGNAVILADREGFEHDLRVPAASAPPEAWRDLIEGARLRAERALGQPVTHAVLALAAAPDPAFAQRLAAAVEGAGLALLRLVSRDDIAAAGQAALGAAILAEDLAPRSPPLP